MTGILSTRQLNRALLARQLLLERVDLPPTRAVERVGGLQDQYAPSAYVALWSRLRDFRRGALTKVLEQRRVVQGTLMRVTIHLVSARDYPLFAAGLRRGRREWWLRINRKQAVGLDMEAFAARARELLRDGPIRAPELAARLQSEGFPSAAMSGLGLWLDIVRVPPSGTWEKRRADLYGLAEDWLGSSRPTEDEGVAHLVKRYLGGFGPAPLRDIASWAGLPVTTVRAALERLRLRRFRDDQGRELVDLPGLPLPDPETPAPVRFLPQWEALLLAHARRTQVLPERYRGLIFTARNPQSVGTFLVDGEVAGSWQYRIGRVRFEPFGSLPRHARQELEDEAERLTAFHTG